MPGAVAATQWWIVYMDEKPCILASGANEDDVLNGMRAALMGRLGDTKLAIKNVFDAPIDDVVRAGILAIMTATMGIAGALGQAPPGLRH